VRPEEAAGVRRADPASFPELTALLCETFADEPVLRWLFPSPAERRAAAEGWFWRMLIAAAWGGEIWEAGEAEAVAVWCNEPVVSAAGGHAAQLEALLGHEIERRAPAESHVVLAALAAAPQRRGLGLGRAVLRPVLERERSVFLSTSWPGAVAFYEHLGFAVTGSFSIAAGPRIWTLHRRL